MDLGYKVSILSKSNFSTVFECLLPMTESTDLGEVDLHPVHGFPSN